MAKPSFVRCKVLAVDDDSTSLSNVSAILRFWHYEVVTVKRPVEALATIRNQRDFDLILTELRMPDMNGIQLKEEIDKEFNLPVIVMSSDERGHVIIKSLKSGVVLYITKPVKPDDLKNVWQFAVTSRSSSANRKARVTWTCELHNKFLQAIRHISLEKAVPNSILEFMNVPGLTREHVSSHLQRYRNFLTRVAEKPTSASSAFNSSSNNSVLGNQTNFQYEESNPLSYGGGIMNDNIGGSAFKDFGGYMTSGLENMEIYSNYGPSIGQNNDGEFFATASASAVANEQAINTSVMPQYSLGSNDFTFGGLMTNNFHGTRDYQNPDLSWNEPTLDQSQEIEESMNPELSSNIAYSFNNYYASL